jgi:hypothetical protein
VLSNTREIMGCRLTKHFANVGVMEKILSGRTGGHVLIPPPKFFSKRVFMTRVEKLVIFVLKVDTLLVLPNHLKFFSKRVFMTRVEKLVIFVLKVEILLVLPNHLKVLSDHVFMTRVEKLQKLVFANF